MGFGVRFHIALAGRALRIHVYVDACLRLFTIIFTTICCDSFYDKVYDDFRDYFYDYSDNSLLQIILKLSKSKVFARKSRVFALLDAKALDFDAKTLEFGSQIQGFCTELQGFLRFWAQRPWISKALGFFDGLAKSLVKFQVG